MSTVAGSHGTMKEDGELINLHFTAGQVCVWHAKEVDILRKKHHIVGSLIGALPSAPRQNAQLGLPLQLMPEEAAVLLQHGVAKLVTMSVAKPRPQQVLEFKQRREESIREQKALWQKHQLERQEQLREVIAEGKRRKREKQARKEDKIFGQVEQNQVNDGHEIAGKEFKEDEASPTDHDGCGLGKAVKGSSESRSCDQGSPAGVPDGEQRLGAEGEVGRRFEARFPVDRAVDGQSRCEGSASKMKHENKTVDIGEGGTLIDDTCRGHGTRVTDINPLTQKNNEPPSKMDEVEKDEDSKREMHSAASEEDEHHILTSGRLAPEPDGKQEDAMDTDPQTSNPQESALFKRSGRTGGSGRDDADDNDEQRRMSSKGKESDDNDGMNHEQRPMSAVKVDIDTDILKMKSSSSCKKDDIVVKDGGCSIQLFTAEPVNSELILEAPQRAWHYPSTEREELRYRVFLHFWKIGYFITAGNKFGGDFLVYPGDPFVFHSYFIVVCIPFNKQLSALDLISRGRLGTFVKKTVVLCSLDSDKQVVCTSLQWSGIS